MRHLLTTATLLIALLATGCAGLNTVSSEVSSYGDWPPGRQAGTYAFDRLPSQQAQAAEIERLEKAARPALEKAGFKPAADGQAPEVLVQLGARASRSANVVWADPVWWRGGFGGWRQGPWLGSPWGASAIYLDTPRYQHEVAVLLRDRASGKPLFEARAVSEGITSGDDGMLGALMQAALMDFPKLGVNPRRVVVQVSD